MQQLLLIRQWSLQKLDQICYQLMSKNFGLGFHSLHFKSETFRDLYQVQKVHM